VDKSTIATLARELARELAPHLIQIIREATHGSVHSTEALPVTQTVLRYGALEINTARHEVLLRGRLVEIKPREFAVLVSLARHPGQVLSRELLLELAWPADKRETIEDHRTVDVHINRLRRRLGDEIIKTIPGVGYKLDDKAQEP
jgi:DNA-binding response OmpR family regulator